MYRPLQYSIYQFRTAVLSVGMFPLLSSMTATYLMLLGLGESLEGVEGLLAVS